MSYYKGSRYTKPETALRRLRKNIEEAISINDFLKFNRSGLTFTFYLYDESSCVVLESEKELYDKLIDNMNVPIPDKHNASNWQAGGSKKSQACKKVTVKVKSPKDIINIIILSNISQEYNRVTRPVVNEQYIAKPSQEMLEALVS